MIQIYQRFVFTILPFVNILSTNALFVILGPISLDHGGIMLLGLGPPMYSPNMFLSALARLVHHPRATRGPQSESLQTAQQNTITSSQYHQYIYISHHLTTKVNSACTTRAPSETFYRSARTIDDMAITRRMHCVNIIHLIVDFVWPKKGARSVFEIKHTESGSVGHCTAFAFECIFSDNVLRIEIRAHFIA